MVKSVKTMFFDEKKLENPQLPNSRNRCKTIAQHLLSSPHLEYQTAAPQLQALQEETTRGVYHETFW